MGRVSIKESSLTSIGDAIRAKTGKTGLLTLEQMPSEIASISGGISIIPASHKDINFYDYDGILVASYTLEEAHALTALPEAPIHEGLAFQGWNWSLDKIKALTHPMNAGAIYITDDGKTRLHIRVSDMLISNVPLYFSQTVANGVTIDWGDGSDTETLSGTGNVKTSHQYTATGDYIISLAVDNGCKLGLGHGNSNYSVMGSSIKKGIKYCNMLLDAYLGNGVTSIRYNAFGACSSLTSITIPNSVTIIDHNAFKGCSSLASIVIPDRVTSIGTSAFFNCFCIASIAFPEAITVFGLYSFQMCNNLTSIVIPDNITEITKELFNSCYCLTNIVIPDNVTKIFDGAFRYCYGIEEYHLKPTTPPTLTNTNAFLEIPSDCKIYVPIGSLEAYKTATNWSSYADYMIGE